VAAKAGNGVAVVIVIQHSASSKAAPIRSQLFVSKTFVLSRPGEWPRAGNMPAATGTSDGENTHLNSLRFAERTALGGILLLLNFWLS
jgi:hypothetical protein